MEGRAASPGFGSSRSSRPSGFGPGFGPDQGMGMGSQPQDMTGFPPAGMMMGQDPGMGFPRTGMMGQDPGMGLAPGNMTDGGTLPEGAPDQGGMMGYPAPGYMGQGPMMGYPSGPMMEPMGQSEGAPDAPSMMGYPPAGMMGPGPMGGYGGMPPMMQDPTQMMNERYSAMEQRMDRIESMLQEILDNQRALSTP